MKKRYKINPYSTSLYYPAEVSRFLKMSPSRVHRWLKGYNYPYKNDVHVQPPIVCEDKDSGREVYASFLEFIDLIFVKQFLYYGVSLQKVRKALSEAKERLNTTRFIHQSFYTDGKNICLQMKKENDAIIELLSHGQLALKGVVEQVAHQIEYDKVSQHALRWYPKDGNGLVVLDPLVSFGKPSIVHKGTCTENIFDLYNAEGSRAEVVCHWLEINEKELAAAINFERSIAA